MQAIQKATEYVRSLFDNEVAKAYTYHNFEHTLCVLESVQEIAAMTDVSEKERLILQMAALFHDTGFTEGPKNHEKRSAQLANDYMEQHGFDEHVIQETKRCILATMPGSKDEDVLAKIIQDADMSGLGAKKFFKTTELLRKEMEHTQSKKISKKEWDLINIQFLQQYNYKTSAAKKLYGKRKEKNISTLKERIEGIKMKTSTKEKTTQTISTNKSAQTQFKTALRNHIDLSNIADNKSNIMLSVNALILTVALPFLVDKSIDNSHFLIPTVIMSLVCLASMIYATLATRPIKMDGQTSQEQIQANQSNLFFFGNYHKMRFEEYKEGIEHVLSDNKALDDSIIRDLFYLGKSLGKKFEYLRMCYNIFMYGISLTVVSLLIVYFI